MGQGLRYTLVAVALLASAIAGGYVYSTRPCHITGEVFRLDEHGKPKMAAGIRIHVYRARKGLNYDSAIDQEERQTRDFECNSYGGCYNEGCDNLFFQLNKKLADITNGFGAEFMYRPYHQNALDEWHEIENDPQFKVLSSSKRTLVRQEFFWRRQFMKGDAGFKESSLDASFKDIFREELAAGQSEQTLSDAMIDNYAHRGTIDGVDQGTTDSAGSFSLEIPKGNYLFLAEGPLDNSSHKAVWYTTAKVDGTTRLVLGDPVCRP